MLTTSDLEPSKGEKRRLAILAEARRTLLEDGYAGVSLRQIAARLGISVGNLQYYFATKDDLVETVITSELETSIALLDEVAWDRDNPAPSIHAAVHALMRHHASDAGRFYAIAEGLALYDPCYARLKAEGYEHVLAVVRQLVKHLVPGISPDRQTRLARLLVALIDGASLQIQFGRLAVPDEHVETLAEDVASAVERLLESWR